MTFYRWLRRQRKRNTTVGDLARGVCHDLAAQAVPNTYPAWKAHLMRCHATDAALLTLALAWRRYRRG